MSDQAAFSAALFDPSLSCPATLVSPDGNPARRFAVYRNNVFSSLINALADNYPVVSQVVGDAFFTAMADVYVRSSPPRSPVMAEYGNDFALFIDAFEPAEGLTYLADLARLENLRVRAYHAADRTAVSAADIVHTLTQPVTLRGMRLQLHPGLSLLCSRHAVVSVWAAHQEHATFPNIDLQRRENALILRCGLEVEVSKVDDGTATFIQALKDDVPLGLAAANGLSAKPTFELDQCLAHLIHKGAITHLYPQRKAMP
jgi:hypothetical protein